MIPNYGCSTSGDVARQPGSPLFAAVGAVYQFIPPRATSPCWSVMSMPA